MIKSNKKGGSTCLFSRHYADKYGYLGPFGKNRAQPKTRQKGEIFSMMHVALPLIFERGLGRVLKWYEWTELNNICACVQAGEVWDLK